MMSISSLREKLSLLKNELGSELNDRELYLVLFPLVVHIDEKVNANLSFRSSGLPPLQKELYGKENGGELFYQLTEDLLTKPLINNLIYEVFYFCLSNGFKGKYIQDEMSIESYKSRLASKISLSTKLPNHDHISSDSQVKFYGFPYKYYLAGALGTFVTLLTLIFLSEA